MKKEIDIEMQGEHNFESYSDLKDFVLEFFLPELKESEIDESGTITSFDMEWFAFDRALEDWIKQKKEFEKIEKE